MGAKLRILRVNTLRGWDKFIELYDARHLAQPADYSRSDVLLQCLTIKVGGEMIGSRTRAKVVKNKVAPPFREAEFDIMYGKGISHIGEIVDLGLKFDILKRSGAWFYYGDTRLAQGRDNTKILFEENEALANEVEAKIVAAMQGEIVEESVTPPTDAPAQTPSATPRRRKVNIDIAVDD